VIARLRDEGHRHRQPPYLTVRFREREIPGLEVELRERLRHAEAAVRDGTDLERLDRRPAQEVLGATRRLLHQLADPERHEGDRVVVTGPTWLLGAEIVSATITAVDRFRDVVHQFVDEVDGDPRLLREALAAANAWCETLMGYEHAETFGAED
jgi:hypothetical protein